MTSFEGSSAWTVLEVKKPTPELADHLGNKLLLGNGYVGVRGTLDEYSASEKVGLIPTGIYDQRPGKWREPINFPNPVFAQVTVGTEVLHAGRSRTESHEHGLDFRRGISSRRTEFVVPNNDKIGIFSLASERFVSLRHKNLVCSKITLRSSFDTVAVLKTGVDGNVWDINGPHLDTCRAERSHDGAALFTKTLEKGISVVAANRTIAPEKVSGVPATEASLLNFKVSLRAFEEKEFFLFGYVGYGPDEPENLEQVTAALKHLTDRGYAALRQDQELAWETLWKSSDVVIEGDPEAQHALRYSLYHLWSIAPHHTEATSIPARGLSGQVYKGAVFWDTELFMFPFFLHTSPKLARTLLEYRVKGLIGAQEKAKSYGYQGAFYAWESQEDGFDACTHFNVTNVFTGRPTRTFFRDKQVHISGDIPLAFREYFRVTGDHSLLVEGGAEVIYECARFFLSWSHYKPEKERFELLDVTGPDEYHERVNNNYFTNVLCKHALESALWAYETMQKEAPEAHEAILERTRFQSILPAIREMAAHLYIAQPSSENGVIPQFDGYFGLEDVSLAELNERKKHPHEYLGGGEGLAVWTQILKQADVVLTLSTFPGEYSTELKRANFRYYEPRTEHGSSLSACSYAIIAAEIGDLDFAYKYFMKTATIDLTGNSKQYVGDLFIGGTHPAANGGAWLAVLKGFCGIVPTKTGLSLSPRLPKNWERVTVPMKLGANSYSLSIGREDVVVTATSTRQPHHTFVVQGRELRIH